jgi:5-methylcytosine-specific restriction protein B
MHPLNQILYGPPGTGKTYNTINTAVQIIDGTLSDNREDIKARFEKLKEQGQIEFITFHQSYGYEEFIQGIKATTDDNGNIFYGVEDGIFKRLCKLATSKELFYIGQKILKYEIIYVSNDLIKLKRENGNIIPIPIYLLKELFELLDKKVITISDIKNKIAIDKMTSSTERFIINGYPNIFKGLCEYYLSNNRKTKVKNYILIIDEINRGNISKIFGELITLIEPSKRIGENEEIKVKLPNSPDTEAHFGVPNNLYIIGTMNTADRSIAHIDTALRRRFEFIEMMPKYDKLDFKIDTINIKELLKSINDRIEVLYDREHTIGHAYFINLSNESSITDLKLIFKNKIIPLLAEYFYSDWDKIDLIFNRNGFINSNNVTVGAITKKIYSINDTKLDDIVNYQKIINNTNEE